MLRPRQSQVVSQNATALQAGRDIIVNITGEEQRSKRDDYKEGSWILVPRIEYNFRDYVQSIDFMLSLGEYDIASHLYWKILYFSGYRGLWKDRLYISRRVLAESRLAGDFRNAGLILTRGIAYTFSETGELSQANRVLRVAYSLFHRERYRIGEASCYSRNADIFAARGEIDSALRDYNTAISLNQIGSVNRRQLELRCKLLMMNVGDEGKKNGEELKKIRKLLRLKQAFFEIRDYREGLVDEHVGDLLIALQDKEEALKYYRRSEKFFSGDILMPRHLERVTSKIKSYEDDAVIHMLNQYTK